MALTDGCLNVTITDIRRGGCDHSLLDAIHVNLNSGLERERRLPTLLLYDDQGLKLFEDITYLDEYYLTNAEIEVLANHAEQIADHVKAGSVVIELGSGYAQYC